MARKIRNSRDQFQLWEEHEEVDEVKQVHPTNKLFYGACPRRTTTLNWEGHTFEVEYISEFQYLHNRERKPAPEDNEELRIAYGCSKGTVYISESPWAGYFVVEARRADDDPKRWVEAYKSNTFNIGERVVNKNNRMEIFDMAIDFAKKILVSMENS